MLRELFYWVLNMGITASVMGLLIAPLRAIRRLPRRLTILLWIVPFVRLWLPVGLNSCYSLMSLIARLTTITVPASQELPLSYTNMVMAVNSYAPLHFKTPGLAQVFSTASFVWLVAALMLLLALGFVYGITLREMRDARHWKDNVYLSEKVQSPAVFGILRPRIVLPTALQHRDCTLILRHEQAHIRRGDNLWRLLAFLSVAVHWYQPFAWIFLKLFLSDLELACDERVLASCIGAERKNYARALLDCAEQKTLFTSAFGGAKIRTRIENILSFRKLTGASALCFSILFIAIVFSLLTNAG